MTQGKSTGAASDAGLMSAMNRLFSRPSRETAKTPSHIRIAARKARQSAE